MSGGWPGGGEYGALEPVEIIHVPDHPYRRVPGRRGCQFVYGAEYRDPRLRGKVCGRAQFNPLHKLPSLNLFGSGADHFVYQNAKQAWTDWLVGDERVPGVLAATGLPRGLGQVTVEGQMCFPTRGKRDQGNHRYFIEKILGDALVAGGWLPDDDWDHYEFGNLQKTYERGARWTRLMLFPAPVEEPGPALGQLRLDP